MYFPYFPAATFVFAFTYVYLLSNVSYLELRICTKRKRREEEEKKRHDDVHIESV